MKARSLLGALQKTWNAAFGGVGRRVASSLPLMTYDPPPAWLIAEAARWRAPPPCGCTA